MIGKSAGIISTTLALVVFSTLIYSQTTKTKTKTSSKTTTINEKGETVETKTSSGSISISKKNGISKKKSLTQYLLDSEEFISQENFDEAVISANNCVRYYPKDARCFYNRGKARALNDLPEQAENDFDQALKLNPDYKNEWDLDLTFTSLKKQFDVGNSSDRERQQRALNAIALYSFLIKLTPKFDRYEKRGSLYKILGKLDLAENDFNSAISMNPESKSAYESRAEVFCLQEKHAEAANDETKLIELGGQVKKSCEEISKEILAANAKNNDVEENTPDAVKNVEEPLDSFASANKFYTKGILSLAENDYSTAHDNFTKSIAADPKFELAYLKRGDAQIQMCNLDKAMADYKKGEQINPANFEFVLGQANVYLYKNDANKAFGELKRAESVYEAERKRNNKELADAPNNNEEKSTYYDPQQIRRGAESVRQKEKIDALRSDIIALRNQGTPKLLPCKEKKQTESPFLKKKSDSPFLKKNSNL